MEWVIAETLEDFKLHELLKEQLLGFTFVYQFILVEKSSW